MGVQVVYNPKTDDLAKIIANNEKYGVLLSTVNVTPTQIVLYFGNHPSPPINPFLGWGNFKLPL